MKVIEGKFGDQEGPQHAGESLQQQLTESGVLEAAEGRYVLIFDLPESIGVLTNSEGAGDVLLTLEKGKTAIMSSVFHTEVSEGGSA